MAGHDLQLRQLLAEGIEDASELVLDLHDLALAVQQLGFLVHQQLAQLPVLLTHVRHALLDQVHQEWLVQGLRVLLLLLPPRLGLFGAELRDLFHAPPTALNHCPQFFGFRPRVVLRRLL